ncbi:Ubiquitin-60S ribosomal protein L40 [Trichoplax sp. H2]|uniref:Ubiquitin-like domain-containing protein n=1 Tax=Trichoplax adhaerens TaxID=10228 RepID=B3SCG2_TRIAD|nr:hypothetical protein TRIADDRAFT_33247 [Trichoplax adhaerens]EDV19589.1 hypothetical protein TRIADDRAFT_33247 [Trichoplax adhaerens]RDD41629.1 Ubiquitin-60S ribosomal protein L40 [Trichoplax sp. H2]|eukprot:XP_002117922.1 hypothetical protein TRIADDRAFT_33247 [Trichoplax adhaerens]
MFIYIKTSMGKLTRLIVDPSDTIEMVKMKYEFEVGIPSGKQRLVFGGLRLEDEHTLAYYGIQNGKIGHVSSPIEVE